jgi:hypothetical protein
VRSKLIPGLDCDLRHKRGSGLWASDLLS